MPELPPIFVISLPGSGRRSVMAERLARWPGRWTFVDGVNGSALSQHEISGCYDDAHTVRAFGRSLSRPELGCALSHREVYRRIVAAGVSSAIVLEDDAILKDDFFEFPFGQIDTPFDVINFYTKALVRRRAERSAGRFQLLRVAGPVMYAVGYMVSARGAARLSSATQTIRSVADWPILPEYADFFVTSVPLLEHTLYGSTIEPSRARMRTELETSAPTPNPIVDWISTGNIQYFTVPAFIKYFARRNKYLDIRDYVRREIVHEVKAMLTGRYYVLNHEKVAVAAPTVFVISLPGSPRRAAIERQLSRWPGPWTFVDAVDGSALTPRELDSHYDSTLAVKAYQRPMSPPEIGCALSHRLVYDRILREGLETAIVLEDDAALKDEFFEFPFREIGSSFDVLSLYTSIAFVHRQPNRSVRQWRLHLAAGFANNTVGYLITNRGASRLREASQPIRFVADWPVPPEDLEFFVLSSGLLDHSPLDSTIQASRREMEEQARQAGDPIGDLACAEWIKRALVLSFIKYFVQKNRYLDIRDYIRKEFSRPRKARSLDRYMYLSHDNADGERT